MWTVIIGPNGTAKTTILQAIALAAAGSLQVNRLAQRVVGHLVDRRAAEPMALDVSFGFSQRASDAEYHPLLGRELARDERLLSGITLERKQNTIMGGAGYVDGSGDVLPLRTNGHSRDPLDDARAKSTPLWFVAGYGISRVLPSDKQPAELTQAPIERLEPLFPQSSRLTSLGFLDLLDDEKAREFAKALRSTLTRVETLVPKLVGMDLGGRHGVTGSGTLMERDRFYFESGTEQLKMPAAALSHGYQSTLAWIADLVGQVMWEAKEAIDAADMEGLVLIDEIDLYLHPNWQASLIPALRQTFPKMQFVVTTHSPVVLSSLEAHEIVAVDQNPETGDVERFVHDEETAAFVPLSQVEKPARVPDPRTMSGADLYRTWFGIDRLTPFPHGKLLREYSMLATDPWRTDEEQAELDKLIARLDALAIHHDEPVGRVES